MEKFREKFFIFAQNDLRKGQRKPSTWMNNQSLFMDQFKPNNGAVLVVAGLEKKPSEKGQALSPIHYYLLLRSSVFMGIDS